MLIANIIRITACVALFASLSLCARDTIIEFKGGAFIPTNDCFQNIYGHGAGIFGPEVTMNICNEWYAFASVDYLKKEGSSLGLCNETTVRMVPLAFGLKYFVPVHCADLYAGLGIQPVHLKTDNCSPFVEQHTSQWAVGGIAKLGAYIDLPRCLVLDLFVNYSFVKAGCPNICQPSCDALQPRKANISGVVLGAGLGYRFN